MTVLLDITENKILRFTYLKILLYIEGNNELIWNRLKQSFYVNPSVLKRVSFAQGMKMFRHITFALQSKQMNALNRMNKR